MVQNKNKLKVSANVYNIVGELFNYSISYFFHTTCTIIIMWK